MNATNGETCPVLTNKLTGKHVDETLGSNQDDNKSGKKNSQNLGKLKQLRTKNLELILKRLAQQTEQSAPRLSEPELELARGFSFRKSKADAVQNNSSHKQKQPTLFEFDSHEAVDYSQLRKPVLVGSPALEQIVSSVLHGTPEVRNFLLYECSIIYECCVCNSLFRGLPNFITHKRVFCVDSYRSSLVKFLEHTSESYTDFVEPRAPEEMEAAEPDPWNEGLSDAAQLYNSIVERQEEKSFGREDTQVRLIPIETNPNAVYQMVSGNCDRKKFMNSNGLPTTAQYHSQGDDIENQAAAFTNQMLASTQNLKNKAWAKPKNIASLSNDKKTNAEKNNCEGNPKSKCTNQYDRKSLTCLLCNTVYSSLKTLYTHMSNMHQTERTLYQCPICDILFFKQWSVQRHLMNVHKKTKAEMELLRKNVKVVRATNVLPGKRMWTRTLLRNSSCGNKQKTPDAERRVASKRVHTDAESPDRKKHKTEDCTKITGENNTLDSSIVKKIGAKGKDNSSRNNNLMVTAQNDAKVSMAMPNSAPVTTTHCELHSSDSESELDDEVSSMLILFKCKYCDMRLANRKEFSAHIASCSKLDHASKQSEDMVKMDKSRLNKKPCRAANNCKKISLQSNTGKQKQVSLKPKNDKDVEEETGDTEEMPKSLEDWNRGLELLFDKSSLKCFKCDEVFTKFHDAKRHVIIHTGWRRYRCNLCKQKRFNRHDLRAHILQSHKHAIRGNETDVDIFVTDLLVNR